MADKKTSKRRSRRQNRHRSSSIKGGADNDNMHPNITGRVGRRRRRNIGLTPDNSSIESNSDIERTWNRREMSPNRQHFTRRRTRSPIHNIPDVEYIPDNPRVTARSRRRRRHRQNRNNRMDLSPDYTSIESTSST